ncbi:MAG: bifunctional metallophosphatase/5'-nucleotidase, partial [Candidatus Hydrogenedens sp.]
VGGIPYIAGFVNNVREENPDVLLLDAGDLTDKGDMVADLTDGEMMYKIIEQMKYDVMVIGNHDYDKGIERLCKLRELSPSVEFVGTNYKEGLEHCYKPWVVKKVGNLPIGFIGVVKLGGEEMKVARESVPELKKAIDELKKQGCHFIIALCHLGSNACAEISKKIPEISVFISGHTHELLKEARQCEDTNAIIVQAGSYAMYAGHLKLVIDNEKQKISRYTNQVVEMKHDIIKPDEGILNWVSAEEKKICPIASEFLIDNRKLINTSQIGVLSANAIKERANADIAFCHPRLLIRSTFPPTKLDYNAVYLTAGHRAKELVEITLTGKQIEQYLIDLLKYGWSRT